jgi:hypothetical protein
MFEHHRAIDVACELLTIASLGLLGVALLVAFGVAVGIVS